MKKVFKSMIIVIGILIVVSAFAYTNGWFSVTKDTHPPCGQLPNVNKVTKELADHQELAEEVKTMGENIAVEVGKPCSNDQSQALIQVRYDKKSERDAISNLLSRRDGFGVPVHLVKR